MSNGIDGIVPIGHKPIVERSAVATGLLRLSSDSADAIRNGLIAKGDVLEASTVAAIQAVKDTPRIIPHCHVIPIEGCNVSWDWEEDSLRCTLSVSAHWKTGVEMEAIVGVSAGLLCAWDMVKSLEKDDQGQYPETQIESIQVLEKKKGS
ncbi:MAG TPA: cyclic pyranopterin monophosphate synthase MoaC [Candidatus Poseidoniales archaeon]|jgi:cyclic pyranopterin phosphate synthase|nr:MAG: cyclic pyranopterin monophosphate synthase MoaC [Euryarchaeota archaeon]HHZ74006.1 cyclic pyranopterin monophosphate synthase MoaC [Candidatus Poseidoniales archaeon]PXY76255.1 MAG: cyclic pyranopterin monophosphate synthase MoaC [Euryarchaeota archaeon]PXY77757.1 MAG: cyclic pyranopterin monophosphate synthase MoaC [Euryarchaeota archaeon]PXY79382.1 MAG: cyclic pyranopterin monophosphate synthase MoaC [Euryarchaeota archaeon]|tara:strand:+ start:54 stop:503 length:450 start_codon:yes stop_codon:yes gene_type:complete